MTSVTEPGTGSLSPSQVESFRREGYVKVPGVVPLSRIQESRRKLAALFDGKEDPAYGDYSGVRSDILARHEWLADMILSAPVLAALRSLVGDRIVLLPENSVMDSQFGGWHTDITSAELLGETFRTDPSFNVLNAAIYFQGNGKYGGGLDVVPGSHLKPDVFVQSVREKYAAHEQTKGKESLKAKAYKIVSALVPNALLEARRKRKKAASQPLQATSNQPGQTTIMQSPGDLVVFDLRLSHKATWPETHDPIPPDARKFSFFVICGADNETTRKYCRYLVKRSETQDAYRYLRDHKYPVWLTDKARAAGITLL